MTERRWKLRADASAVGRAVLPGRQNVACIVENFSAAGACVSFAAGIVVPKFFKLAIGQEQSASPVRIAWRRANMVGVAYVTPRPAPDVIAG